MLILEYNRECQTRLAKAAGSARAPLYSVFTSSGAPPGLIMPPAPLNLGELLLTALLSLGLAAPANGHDVLNVVAVRRSRFVADGRRPT